MYYENSRIMLKEVNFMKNIILCILIFLLIFLYGCNFQNQLFADECSEMIYNVVKTSYNNYGDFSKLPKKYQGLVSEDYYDRMNYRENDNGEYGKLGVDYYEKNILTYPITEIKGNEIYVSYSYTYECYSCSDDDLLRGSSNIPVKITLEKDGDNYIIVDYYESP